MSKRNSNLLLYDILESAQSIIEYTKNYAYEEFLNDKRTIDAVIRNYEVIGEASNKLSEEVKNTLPGFEWFKVRGLEISLYMNILE